jgi:adenosylcobinamide-GDP ribazoletransferase
VGSTTEEDAFTAVAMSKRQPGMISSIRGIAMAMPGAWLRSIATDLKISVLFCTCLPIPNSVPVEGAGLARASWAFPIAGALVGLIGALVYWLAHVLGLPPLPAAALALAATLAATGCLHEDGLADVADGFGAGATREQKLEIMRDSRIGTYGTCAVMTSLLLRASALAIVAEPSLVAMALIAAHAGARAGLPMFMAMVPPARADGLSAGAATPPGGSVVTAGLLGVAALGVVLGPVNGFVAFLLVMSSIVFLAWLCTRQIGGQTGDVLGASEQVSEILILLTAAAASM